MAEKNITLEDLARAEAAVAEQREALKRSYLEGQKKLLTLVPERFFTMAQQVREGIARFNGAARLPKPIHYSESAAVTTRDSNPNADFIVEVRRDPSSLVLAMRNMGRVGKPDALIIEGAGSAGIPPKHDRFRLRIEGLVKEGEIIWRTTCDFKPVDTPLGEMPDRLVAVVATGELTRLWTTAPFGGSA